MRIVHTENICALMSQIPERAMRARSDLAVMEKRQ